jgi:hypothetical protein
VENRGIKIEYTLVFYLALIKLNQGEAEAVNYGVAELKGKNLSSKMYNTAKITRALQNHISSTTDSY